MQMIARRIWGAGVAYNLALGFIPDFVDILMYNATPASNKWLRWHGPLFNACTTVIAGGGLYGHLISGTDGTVTEATANTGIQAYDGTKVPKVLIDSPMPGKGLVSADVLDWAASTASTQRSATTIGTIVRPTTHNGYVYECTTTGTGHTAEPTWPTTPGETVAEGAGSGVWTCREENVVNEGELGITIGLTLAADGQVLFVIASKADTSKDLGDVV